MFQHISAEQSIDAGLVAAPPVPYPTRARRAPPTWLAAPSAAPASHPVARRRGQTSPASIPEYQKNRFLGPFARLLASNQSEMFARAVVRRGVKLVPRKEQLT